MITPLFSVSKGQYFHRVKRVFGSSLIGYWPLDEPSGTIIYDRSGNGLNGTSNGPTPGSPGIGDGKTAYSFDAINDQASVHSAGLASLFNGPEGSISVWFKASDASTWTDAVARRIFEFAVDVDNSVKLLRTTTNGQMYLRYEAGNVIEYLYLAGLTSLAWLHVTATWSKSNDRVRVYLNGKQYLANATALGDWAGAINAAVIGQEAGATSVWDGFIAHLAVGNRELTPSEVYALTRLNVSGPKLITVFGDSITDGSGEWPYYLWGSSVGSYRLCLANHAVTGASVMNGLDAQVVAAAGDNADVIIIALGTNDDNGGNMDTLKAEVEENITELKASNPNAVLYYMNVLPRWTDVGGGTEVDKSNIRTAIAAACTAQAITCWDTYSTPWITADQTTDGCHPNAAGHQTIATEVLARL